jgi:phosphonate transport system permease protein
MSAAERRAGPHQRTRGLAAAALAIVAIAWTSALASGLSLGALWSAEGLARAQRIVAGLSRPALGAEFVTRVLVLLLESIAIGLCGVVLALALGIPLAMVATRLPALPHARDRDPGLAVSGLRAAARALLAIFRSVPELVWAYLFVRIFGLGPAPAVVAIGLSFAGIVGKLYAELAEAADPRASRALIASGAGRFAVLLYAVVPQVRRAWSGYGLFRLECAVRSAAILGVVGAGGVGAEIELSIRYFQYDRLATALLALIGCIALLEAWSAIVRRHPARRLDLATFGVGGLLGLLSLDAAWGEMFDGPALRSAWAFVRAFADPTLTLLTAPRTLHLVVETLGMAAWGTLVAAVLAALLAPLASRGLLVAGSLEHAARPRGPGAWLLRAVLLGTRGLLMALRALPELVLALVFVVWVGPGPLAGALAIAAHTTGILGRLFAETIEDGDPDPARVLEAAGAGRVAIFVYGLLPQATPRLLAFVLFRFEVNVRATAMVGFVGAGGIGDAIHTAISLFHMSDLAALLLLMLATVMLVDSLGDRLRARLIA